MNCTKASFAVRSCAAKCVQPPASAPVHSAISTTAKIPESGATSNPTEFRATLHKNAFWAGANSDVVLAPPRQNAPKVPAWLRGKLPAAVQIDQACSPGVQRACFGSKSGVVERGEVAL